MPHVTLAICDLNAAVAAKDGNNAGYYAHNEICLFAQMVKRVTEKKVIGSTRDSANLEGDVYYNFFAPAVRPFIDLFDEAFTGASNNIDR